MQVTFNGLNVLCYFQSKCVWHNSLCILITKATYNAPKLMFADVNSSC